MLKFLFFLFLFYNNFVRSVVIGCLIVDFKSNSTFLRQSFRSSSKQKKTFLWFFSACYCFDVSGYIHAHIRFLSFDRKSLHFTAAIATINRQNEWVSCSSCGCEFKGERKKKKKKKKKEWENWMNDAKCIGSKSIIYSAVGDKYDSHYVDRQYGHGRRWRKN